MTGLIDTQGHSGQIILGVLSNWKDPRISFAFIKPCHADAVDLGRL